MTTLRNLLTADIFSTFAGLPSGVVRAWRGVMAMTMLVADLQSKVEKYESRASRCQEEATDKAQQSFYEVLAGYYSSLATDFRKIMEKRSVA